MPTAASISVDEKSRNINFWVNSISECSRLASKPTAQCNAVCFKIFSFYFLIFVASNINWQTLPWLGNFITNKVIIIVDYEQYHPPQMNLQNLGLNQLT